MKTNDIKAGETYFFVATDSPARKHLEGTPFEVVQIKPVWRRLNKKSKRVKRFFDADGNGARADELEPFSNVNIITWGKAVDWQVKGSEPPATPQPIDDLPF